jgi:hypothetical protein
MIVIALIGMFVSMTMYFIRDTRIAQTRAERLTNQIYDIIRTARNNMVIGRGVLSGSTLVVTNTRSVNISSTGVLVTFQNGSQSGTEISFLSPFFDNDADYKISNIAVSSGAVLDGVTPIWDQNNLQSIRLQIFPNMNIVTTATGSTGTPISTPIRTIKVTSAYATFEKSVILDPVI